jgi:glyoxylase-like metal-dependent hydrolase (beta-lactamase superfamily II)
MPAMASLYLKQLLIGRDVGKSSTVGRQMQNFVYLVGDRDAHECIVIDPAWDIRGIVDVAHTDDMKIIGALATHYHPDHIGGSLFGFGIAGIADLIEINPCKIHVHKLEASGVRKVTGVEKTDLSEHDSGDKIKTGEIEIEWLHTPGHTPGSSCFRVKDALLAGDTLFLQGCGRVDLPGGDPDEMRRTLRQRLATLPDHIVLYPGHAYGGENAQLGEVRKINPVFPPARAAAD